MALEPMDSGDCDRGDHPRSDGIGEILRREAGWGNGRAGGAP